MSHNDVASGDWIVTMVTELRKTGSGLEVRYEPRRTAEMRRSGERQRQTEKRQTDREARKRKQARRKGKGERERKRMREGLTVVAHVIFLHSDIDRLCPIRSRGAFLCRHNTLVLFDQIDQLSDVLYRKILLVRVSQLSTPLSLTLISAECHRENLFRMSVTQSTRTLQANRPRGAEEEGEGVEGEVVGGTDEETEGVVVTPVTVGSVGTGVDAGEEDGLQEGIL